MISFIFLSCMIAMIIIISLIGKSQLSYSLNKFTVATFFIFIWISTEYLLSFDLSYTMYSKIYHVKYIVVGFCAPLASLFLYEFKHKKNCNNISVLLTILIPLATAVFYILPITTKFFVTSIVPIQGELSKYEVHFGSLHLIHIFYSYFCVVYNMKIFYDMYNVSSKKSRNKLIGLLVVIVISILYNIILILSNRNGNIDLSPILFAISMVGSYVFITSFGFASMQGFITKNIVANSQDMMLFYEKSGDVSFCNEVFLNYFKIDENSILGVNVFDKNIISELFPADFYNILLDDAVSKTYQLSNGKIYRKNVSQISVGTKTFGTFITFADISKEIEINQRIVEIQNTDALTGFDNRHSLENALDKIEVGRYHDFAIIQIDIKRLKDVNLVFGQNVGDLVILALCDFTKNSFGENSSYYRLGGDELCIIIKNMPKDELDKCFTDLYSNIEEFNSKNMYQLHYSIGYCLKTKEYNTVDLIYQYSEFAIRKSKRSVENCTTLFDEELYTQFVLAGELADDLIYGLSSQDITIFVQPQYHVKDDTYLSCEALIRWNHSVHGLLTPFSFLDIANDLRVLSKLDFIALDKACHCVSHWKKTYNKKISVAVNLSLDSLVKPDLISTIKDTFKKYDVDPSCISFELLESKMIEDLTSMKKIVTSIKKLGAKVAIDDFGTGYSNFETINKIDADYVKIDKSLIDNITHSKKDCKNVQLLCNFISNLGSDIIIEGVETKEQVDILKDIDIKAIQGYYYSKPIPIADFEAKFLA